MSENKLCPDCRSELVSTNDTALSLTLRCRNCGFTEQIPLPLGNTAAISYPAFFGNIIVGAAVGIVAFKWGEENRKNLRDWWHQILREHGKYSCYGFFLVLDGDKETVRYLKEYGNELEHISNDNCLIMSLTDDNFLYYDFGKSSWENAVETQIKKGYSVQVGNLFEVGTNEFPCLVLFSDIRSANHVVVKLDKMTAEDISTKMRVIFSAIHKAVANKTDVLEAIEKLSKDEIQINKKKALLSEIRQLSKSSLATAIESGIKAFIS